MDWHPIQGGIPILSVASCYRNWDRLRPCGPPWLVCDFYKGKSDSVVLQIFAMKLTSNGYQHTSNYLSVVSCNAEAVAMATKQKLAYFSQYSFLLFNIYSFLHLLQMV